MFEVGKKYTSNHSEIAECVFVGTKRAVLRGEGGYEYCPDHTVYHGWKEHKEPSSVTRWVNIYKDRDGKLVMGTYTYYSKEMAEHDCTALTLRKFDTIPITYTEPHTED